MALEELKQRQSLMWGNGQTKTPAESLVDERRGDFHRTWLAFFDDNYSSNGVIDHDREWLLVLGTRR
jgi:hypothetical protein